MPNTTDTSGAPDSARPTAVVGAGHWTLDPAASAVRFRSKTFWGLATVSGVFTGISGAGEVLPDGAGRGTLTIEAATLDTKNAKRDTHLRSADFFAADAHPSFAFTATSVTPGEGDAVTVTGELTVREKTLALAFPARVLSAAADAVTLEAEVSVDRAEFGMTWNQLGMLRGPATINVTARFTRDAA
ncbi:YceI family protein [Actinacidiphila alni]|uniref:YceI family protein n=1 Tax=Actinacidiphila alni TaxID=380248 RepID=UPI003453CD5C